ncbi:hypothetical protein NUW54_g9784 [Trametes sanguinea]|uniref:Uncharacterized protein n=1 Tax=Trametes sanguinea TaxID=158606 RepID=A0ACC1P4T9_9APHY|nr:hypothetical protein NUW54_g9784 [Trametes sanguinea]
MQSRDRAGLQAPNRPVASFLFLGPTGVGKTELCKALAGFLFNDESRGLININMSEYHDRHTISRLIGAAPGYVGFEEGGQLTEAVRRKPYAVILLDELEKAHKDVAMILLQILDEGSITDSQGRKVDFKNTIICLTSNLGSDILAVANAKRKLPSWLSEFGNEGHKHLEAPEWQSFPYSYSEVPRDASHRILGGKRRFPDGDDIVRNLQPAAPVYLAPTDLCDTQPQVRPTRGRDDANKKRRASRMRVANRRAFETYARHHSRRSSSASRDMPALLH